ERPRKKQIRRVRLREQGEAGIFRHTDDDESIAAKILIAPRLQKTPAQRIFSRPKMARRRFADDRHRRTALLLPDRKRAPGDQRNPQRLKIIRRDVVRYTIPDPATIVRFDRP